MSENDTERLTLTEEEFCRRVGISVRTAKRLRKRRKLIHCKQGRRIFYRPEHVEQYLRSIEVGPRQRASQ